MPGNKSHNGASSEGDAAAARTVKSKSMGKCGEKQKWSGGKVRTPLGLRKA